MTKVFAWKHCLLMHKCEKLFTNVNIIFVSIDIKVLLITIDIVNILDYCLHIRATILLRQSYKPPS
jgi:hypothetical protein